MQRTLALGAIWTASAGAAVGLGFLAVSLVDASASPGTTPAASTGTSTSSSAEVSTTPTAPVTSATGEHATVAGTVFANCTGGSPVLAGAPAAGWWIDDSSDPGEIEFENGTEKLEVRVVCSNGGPRFSVEGPRPDSSGNGGGNDDVSTTPTPTAPIPTSPAAPSPDDHGGDNRGPGSDDSGGGHGSDG